ncbi:MAG: hypothetical protein WC586_06405 [Methanoregula sp.]
MTISYVFPNTSDIPQRGGLDYRRELAKSAGCSFIEVPADLIKKGSEVTATGQELGSFLTKQSIAELYTPTQNQSGTIPYILHTDPSLSRTDNFGIKMQPPLRWNDPAWTEKFVRMILDISDFLGTPSAKIEIHPGDRRNSFADIVRGVKTIQTGYQDSFGIIPEILLENRTGQFISDGLEISGLWDYIMKTEPELAVSFGIVLDIQQLSTVTRQNFLESFNLIPPECLKGFHIHRLHQPPGIGDGIPWPEVFAKIAGIGHDVIINPEIHHNNKVAGVIGFCEGMLKDPF